MHLMLSCRHRWDLSQMSHDIKLVQELARKLEFLEQILSVSTLECL